jgi:hypothetical protein
MLTTRVSKVSAHCFAAAALPFMFITQASAQGTPAPKVQPTIKRVFTNDGMVNNLVRAGIGNRIRVEIDKLKDAVEQNHLDQFKLVLYLDGLQLRGLYGKPIDDLADGIVEYKIERTDNSKAEWNTLLGSSKSQYREVFVSVGPENGQGFPPTDPKNPPTMNLRIYYQLWLYGVSVVFVIAVAWFVRRARKTTILRDSAPTPLPDGKLPPYSLARVQMAIWFFLVLGSFIYIYLITGDYNTITEQALVLIGIGAGTALGSVAIDSNKEAQSMASVNFLSDLLTDATGTSFHRFQMLTWTIVLGILFVIGVYKSLAMPEFSTTLLTLMGISSGTYLGFKIPERQA